MKKENYLKLKGNKKKTQKKEIFKRKRKTTKTERKFQNEIL